VYHYMWVTSFYSAPDDTVSHARSPRVFNSTATRTANIARPNNLLISGTACMIQASLEEASSRTRN